MTSSALIVITLMNTSWNDMEICIEFLPDWSRNVESTDQYALIPLSKVLLSLSQFLLNSC